jgi:hypothetical protein
MLSETMIAHSASDMRNHCCISAHLITLQEASYVRERLF